jgi:hypothetical protein
MRRASEDWHTKIKGSDNNGKTRGMKGVNTMGREG